MELKPGDLARTKADLWPVPSRRSDSNGHYNHELVCNRGKGNLSYDKFVRYINGATAYKILQLKNE